MPTGQLQTLVLWRGALGVGGLLVFLAWEQRRPLRTLAQPKLQHYTVNVGLALANVAILRFAFGSLGLGLASWTALRHIGVLNALKLGEFPNIVATVACFDLVAYALHRLYHAVPLLWSVHQVHHSDIDFDTTTGVRFHPLEVMLSALVRLGVIPILGPSPAGVAIFEMVLLLSSQFEHSNRSLSRRSYILLKWIVVTPNMHRIHHSTEAKEMGSNFSTIFTCWDRLFGTYRDNVREEFIITGLSAYRSASEVRLPKLWLMPLTGCRNQTGQLNAL